MNELHKQCYIFKQKSLVKIEIRVNSSTNLTSTSETFSQFYYDIYVYRKKSTVEWNFEKNHKK